ncbi:hypothetical protein [Methylomonas rivi]|uniref:Uncharacterized protein n=1 Tax=Methylomonas rivi TaxID=2952226 RepID=A0ABT1U468_9GAMM|nr:hypothetical protein [Methylomonas sp. WSC-6]MCQ8128577.1 hypothetical protein [Methylomonas sp. WSC-6]
MSIKTRISKIEKASNPDELHIIITKPFRDKPLPKPVITGAAKVSYRYEATSDADATLNIILNKPGE